MPKLVVMRGDNKGAVVSLQDRMMSIGRDPSNHLILSDRRVSRRHAVIKPGKDGFIIEDLGSVNGTRVNRNPVSRHPLAIGDEITMGSTVMKLLSSHATEQSIPCEKGSQISIVADDSQVKDIPVTMKIAATPSDAQQIEIPSDPAAAQRAYKKLMILYRIGRELSSLTSLSELLDQIVRMVLDIIPADRSFILLVNEESGGLEQQAVRVREGNVQTEDLTISSTITRHVLQTGEGILTSDAAQDTRFQDAQSVILHDIRSMMCVPIRSKNTTLGMILVDTRGKVTPFAKDDLELLAAIGNQAAIALENARLIEDLRKANVELKTQQDQLIEAEKLSALGKLAGGVAHEINNPMTSILGFSQLTAQRLAVEPLDPEKIKESATHMKIVEEEAHRCIRIVQSLLQFSRRKKDEMEKVDIGKVLESSLTIAQFHIKRVPISIEKHIDADLPPVLADSNQLQQVFLNMIINARDALEQGGGTLRITAGREDDAWIAVRFADTGCGIPPDKMEDIFKPLFTTKEEGKGTGLGLPICQDIIERHKGTIDVESEVGQGTTFLIRLPADA